MARYYVLCEKCQMNHVGIDLDEENLDEDEVSDYIEEHEIDVKGCVDCGNDDTLFEWLNPKD